MSGLSNVIVYVTAFIRHHKGVSHNQMPVAARFKKAHLRSASNGCDTTKIHIILFKFVIALGHKTNITNDCSSAKLLSAPSHIGVIPPNFHQISILASDRSVPSCSSLLQLSAFSRQTGSVAVKRIPKHSVRSASRERSGNHIMHVRQTVAPHRGAWIIEATFMCDDKRWRHITEPG